MRNVFGYYTYPTGQEPKSVSDIQPIIAFPFISTFNCNIDNADAVFTGDQVQLQYWNASGSKTNSRPESVSGGSSTPIRSILRPGRYWRTILLSIMLHAR